MLAGQRRRRSPFEVTILFVPVSVVLGQVAACWAEDCDQTTLRLCPICKHDSIVEHGHLRKQAHDEHHDWIEIRRGCCSSEPQRAPGECASSPDCRARNGVVAQYAERDGQAVLRDVLRQRPRALLGDSFHPGGVQLTRRIGNLRSIAVAGMGWLATVVVPRIFMAARSITTSSMSYPRSHCCRAPGQAWLPYSCWGTRPSGEVRWYPAPGPSWRTASGRRPCCHRRSSRRMQAR